MALYFFAMYLLGASLGPIGTGWTSDYFARHAALQGGATTNSATVLAGITPQASFPASVPWVALVESAQIDRAARASGLHQAMYLIPWVGCALVLVLFAASRTVKGDYEKLEKWIAAGHSTCKSIAEKCS